MAYNNPNASYFRPPPETFNMFADLTNDEDDDEESSLPRSRRPSHVPPQTPLFIQEGRALPRIDRRVDRRRPAFNSQRSYRPKEPRHEAKHDTYYLEDDTDLLPKIPTLTAQGRLPPKALRGADPPQRPPSQEGGTPPSTERHDSNNGNGAAFPLQTRYQSSYARARTAARFPKFSAFASPKDKKKVKQVQKIAETEEALRKFLEEFPGDTKLLARVPQLDKYKQKLDRGDELLNSGEAKWVYDLGKMLERRRVAIESKAFEEQIKPQTSRVSKKRKRRDSSSSPSRYSTPTRPSTGGKTIPGYIAEIGDESSDSDDVQDGQRAHKTIEGWDGAGVATFNIQKALAETSESEAEECPTESDDSEESDENDESDEESDEENSGEESSDDNNSDAGVEPVLELAREAETVAEPVAEAEVQAELESQAEGRAEAEAEV